MDIEIIILILLSYLVVSFVVAYFFLRFVFSIKRQMWTQKEQLILLSKIAEKIGVDQSHIDDMKQRMQMTDEFLK